MSIIVVTGIPRSGTSMMMRMLEAGGVPCYYEQVSGPANPDGFYEAPETMGADMDVIATLQDTAFKCLLQLPRLPVDLDARVIVMRRDPGAVIASRDRQCSRLGEPLTPGWYRDHMRGDLVKIREWCAGKPHVEVWYEDLIADDGLYAMESDCLRIARLLGREPGFSDNPLDLAAMHQIPRRNAVANL